MSNAIIPFDGGDQLPAYVQNRKGSTADLTAGVGAGFARLSVKGKTFTIVRNKDDKKVLMNPKDPDSPASYVGVVVVKASPALSRTYYEKAFDDASPDGAPDCSSADGVAPDAGVPKPQCKTCAACPHAVYGTGQNGKGFRCANHRRLVIAKPGAFAEEDLMLLNVPGGSLKNLRSYATMGDERGLDYDMVLTKLSFDPDEATPKLVFTPVGLLPEAMYNEVQGVVGSDMVKQILGSSAASARAGDSGPADDGGEAARAAAEKAAQEKAAAEAKAKAEAEAAAKAKAEAEAAEKAKASNGADEDADLMAMLDQSEAPAAEPAAAPAEATAAPAAGEDDLDAMLAEFDD
jgi:hypothetical protein